jgi:NAD(P)-dependent dehydrogenase (short-subunit alcohol dehydrogenase family)
MSNNKVFFITGSSRGLGRHIAEAVLGAGQKLVATARSTISLADLVKRYGRQVHAVALDVTDPVAAETAVMTAVDAFGQIDVVVNNAGYANLASIEDITLDDFHAQIATNLFGVVNVTKAVVPFLRRQRSGHIIQVSSLGGRLGMLGLSAYAAAKHAVGGFSEALAQEMAPFGVKVTVLEPGGMRTDWAGSSMTIPPISEPYQTTVGGFAKLMASATFKPAGDPMKVARLVLKIAELDDPPLRLLVGTDAITYAAAAEKSRAESDARWRDLSRSTDHDQASAGDVNPLEELRQ